jgi:hypothetical protein
MTFKRREVPGCRGLALQRLHNQRRNQAFDQPSEQEQRDHHEYLDLGVLCQRSQDILPNREALGWRHQRHAHANVHRSTQKRHRQLDDAVRQDIHRQDLERAIGP